ncbi:MAG: hypothetical protein WDM88_02860 [Galbitalea sp.]
MARVERARSGVMHAVDADVPMLTRRRRRRRVSITVAGAGLAAVVLTAGTVAVVQATQEQIGYSVICYSAASTSSDYATASDPTATNTVTGQTDREAADPVSVCGDMWRSGLVGQKPDAQRDPNTANFPIPQLVACTTTDGVGAAFPREGSGATETDFCDSLGLAPWSK